MSPRFCGSCGAALPPGGAFCGACGSAVTGLPQPAAAPPPYQPPPVPQQPAAGPPVYQPHATPQAAAMPPPHYHPAPPAAAPAPAYGYADWSSVEVQPGETSLGNWFVGLRSYGPDVSGSLTVTDRRILFKPKVAGTSLLGMLLSQRKQFKDEHTVVLGRDQVVAVHSEKPLLIRWIYVTTANGTVFGFNRGVMSADPILAALQPR